MKRTICLILMTLFAIASGSGVSAQSAGTQSINVNIQPIAELKVSGGSTSLSIKEISAGDDPVSVSSTAGYYSISTNQSGKKITGYLQEGNTESGTTLSVTLQAPGAGGSSIGEVNLTAQPADLVVGIPAGAHQNCPMTFKFAATVEAGIIPSSTRTVVLTLTDNS